MTSLFDIPASNRYEPLAARMRPRTLDEYLGAGAYTGQRQAA